MRRLVPVVVVVAATAAISVGASIGIPAWTAPRETVQHGGSTTAEALSAMRGGDLAQAVSGLQSHLRLQPRDATSWASLGSAYVETARVTGDPTYYPKAEAALDRSVAEQPDENAPAAAGRAALAAARHDFSAALEAADAALSINPYDAQALAARVDALTELGRYDEALSAANAADSAKPGIPTFVRLSYQAELRGDSAEARRLLDRSLESARAPSDVAFAHFHLGELERTSGRPSQADKHYEAALAADPTYVAALAGRARVAEASGDAELAVRRWSDVVNRLPLSEYLVAYGDLLQSLGRDDEAETQFAVVRAAAKLAAANGVGTDLEIALFEADHGSPAAAVAAAKAEWSRRHSVHAADALGWALHAAGRDREALRFVRRATSLGTLDASFHFHRGMVELSLGLDEEARTSLKTALSRDPHFSSLQAPEARAALQKLEASR